MVVNNIVIYLFYLFPYQILNNTANVFLDLKLIFLAVTIGNKLKLSH